MLPLEKMLQTVAVILNNKQRNLLRRVEMQHKMNKAVIDRNHKLHLEQIILLDNEIHHKENKGMIKELIQVNLLIK